jgi:hypothetical protein
MHYHTPNAAAFVAIAHYSGDTRKTVSFSPDTPIKEVFEAFWPQDRWGKAFAGSSHHPLPLKIEIMPDEKTVPRDERHDNLFKEDQPEAGQRPHSPASERSAQAGVGQRS